MWTATCRNPDSQTPHLRRMARRHLRESNRADAFEPHCIDVPRRYCMKAVDWIIKRQQHLLFVEAKYPASGAAQHHGTSTDFARNLVGQPDLRPDGQVSRHFLYGWACEWTLARVSYFVILTGVDSALFPAQTDQLLRRLPAGPRRRGIDRWLVGALCSTSTRGIASTRICS